LATPVTMVSDGRPDHSIGIVSKCLELMTMKGPTKDGGKYF